MIVKQQNRLNGLAWLLMATLLSLYSCQKEKDPISGPPTVALTEVGSNNGKVGYIGSDLHLEADIKADALIQKIEVEIHQESGNYEITKTYTEGKYVGVRTAEFHEHIDIPAEAPIGDYHIHLTVTDIAGRSTTVESELLINDEGARFSNVQYGSKDVRDDGIANVSYGNGPDYQIRLYIVADIESNVEIESVIARLDQKNTQVGLVINDIDLTEQFEKATGKLNASILVPYEMRRYLGTYNLKLTATNKNGTKTEINNDVEVTINPFIDDFELGSGHSVDDRINRIAYIGRDVHIEGMIYCLHGRLSSIRITITQDVETNPRTLVKDYNTETGYFGAISGSRNNLFHEHIDIPADMPVGNYKFLIHVVDQAGKEYKRELNLELRLP